MVKTLNTSSSDDPHEIVYFDGPLTSRSLAPPRDFFLSCPKSVQAKFTAVLIAVAKAPPKRFSGGGYWEAMHGEMDGWFEVRAQGPGRTHYRLFCLLDYEAVGFSKPLLAVIAGLVKANGEVFSENQYAKVLMAGRTYLAENPRRIV